MLNTVIGNLLAFMGVGPFMIGALSGDWTSFFLGAGIAAVFFLAALLWEYIVIKEVQMRQATQSRINARIDQLHDH